MARHRDALAIHLAAGDAEPGQLHRAAGAVAVESAAVEELLNQLVRVGEETVQLLIEWQGKSAY